MKTLTPVYTSYDHLNRHRIGTCVTAADAATGFYEIFDLPLFLAEVR